jgi:ribosomal-protein-alanine N-acetyltransferase
LYVIKEFCPDILPDKKEKQQIINFLYEHLDQYRDAIDDIGKCVDYALKISESFGGFILMMLEKDKVLGVVVVNKTGMKGYIPENILVYIATHSEYRGKGLGKELMKQTISKASGAIALHVEPENPARYLYEKYGFTSKYLEMRYQV